MEGAAKQQKAPKGKCQHCGDESGTCTTFRCVVCSALLCSRAVTPVLASSPYYPYKHRVNGRYCGPVEQLLLSN